MSDECIFCRIARKEIPVQPVYEDEATIAFRDLNPQAPEHVLLIPKAHVDTVMDIADPALHSALMTAAQEVARRLRLDQEGFRMVINCRENGGQTVYHMHIHILGGRFMQWPPG
jgi:histidine triad (HIT) family protein